jgi:peptide/nickel transport system permease protein
MGKKETNKKRSRFGTWLSRCFLGSRKELSFMEEEALQSPGKTIAKNFFRKKTAVFGVVVFLAIFLFVMIGPYYMPLDLGYSDGSLANISPGYNMMSVPQEMIKNGVRAIAPGATYGLGLDKNGKVYTWGYTRITNTIDISEIPEEVLAADLIDVAAGTDHIVAIDSENQLHFWGNTRLGQDVIDPDLRYAIRKGDIEVKQLEASNQFSALLDQEGNLYLWGNANNADIKQRAAYEGHVKKVALTDFAYIVLLDDDSVAYAGFSKDSPLLVNMPQALVNKEVKIVDIAATSQNVAAVDENGKIYVWGTCSHGEKEIPQYDSKPVEIYGGRYHYTILLENGDVISWGDNQFHQTQVPAAVNEAAGIETIYAGANQNYAVTTDGELITWGLKGFLCGTDDLGRDVLTRIVNGGKTTMTVGAISVIIATIIGVLLGGMAGYFGGKTDILVMRIAEIVGGLPFIPFAMILSAVIGSSMSTTNRMYLIMVVLGVLSWTGTCRLVRAQIFAQREMEYVTAAKTMGVREGMIILKHILPNVMSVLLVSVTLDFATCMLTESTLSYLGFGIPLPAPTWGNMLNGANNSIVIQQYWWRWVFPAAIFGLCTICINLIGDGLRDAMDPKSAER